MRNVDLSLVIRNYDQITPILAGDIVPEGINLRLDRSTPIANFKSDSSFHAGEMSFSRYLQALAAGDSTIIGLPIFVTRGFRHRCFFVRRGGGIETLRDLEGKRIGTNGWSDTGNTWSRAILRSEGVRLDGIEWRIGTIDGVIDQLFGHQISAPPDLDQVQVITEDRTLQDLLLADELDALMVPWPPQSFNEPHSSIVRLIPNYRIAEQAYAQQVGFWPAHHLIGIRSEFADRFPDAVRSLYRMFEQSRTLAEQRRWALADTTPWLLTELEETISLLGQDWQAYGVEPNSEMISELCQELHAQGIISYPLDPRLAFAEFAELWIDEG